MPSQHEHRFSHSASLMHASEIRELLKLTQRPDIISFAGGLPNPDSFPFDEIRKVVDHVLTEHPREALQYGPTEGHNRLCMAIADGMGELFDAPQRVENVLITHGSQQALDLLSHILVDPGDIVLVGSPAYLGATQAFRAFQARFEAVPLDENGIRVDELEAALERLAAKGCLPKFVYLVPTFQNPSGATVPLENRKRIYELMCRYDLLLVEDDPYGFLRYEGDDVPIIKSFDTENRVVYLGSFSKIWAPGFRVAWMIAPEDILFKAVQAKQAQDLCTNTFAQYCVYEAMIHDVFLPHVMHLRDFYREKRDTMLNALDKHFPPEAHWNRPEGGLFLWVTLPESVDTRKMFKRALAEKVAYVVGQAFHCDDGGRNTMRLNFSHASNEMIDEGIRRLGNVIREELASGGQALDSELIGGF